MLMCNLQVLLAERDLTISGLAEITGISRTALSQTANNKTTGIQYDTLNRICTALNVKVSDVLLYYPYDFEIDVHGESPNPDFNGSQTFEGIFSMYISLTDNIELIEDSTPFNIVIRNIDNKQTLRINVSFLKVTFISDNDYTGYIEGYPSEFYRTVKAFKNTPRPLFFEFEKTIKDKIFNKLDFNSVKTLYASSLDVKPEDIKVDISIDWDTFHSSIK